MRTFDVLLFRLGSLNNYQAHLLTPLRITKHQLVGYRSITYLGAYKNEMWDQVEHTVTRRLQFLCYHHF